MTDYMVVKSQFYGYQIVAHSPINILKYKSWLFIGPEESCIDFVNDLKK